MNTSSSAAPTTVELRRGSLYGLLAGVAILAAGVTSLLLVFAANTGSSGLHNVRPAAPSHSATGQDYVSGVTSMTRIAQAAAFGGHGGVLDALGLSARDKRYVKGVTSLTQAQQAAAYGR